MIDLRDLLEGNYKPRLEFLGDGVDYWDYDLTLASTGDICHESSCNANLVELEQLRDNAKRLYHLLEGITDF